jgi:hypothetical protein
MGHSWKAEIIRADGVTKITFADGDDVARTQHVGLAEEPQATMELNVPSRATLRINNNWRVAAYNLMSPSCALWSGGSPGAIARGMYVRIEQAGTTTHIGRIKKIEEGDNGQIVITSYDDLMQLGEFREQAIFFNSAVDRIGDATLANGPNITTAFNSAGQIEAALPHTLIVAPLMRLSLAEPGQIVDENYLPNTDDMSTGDLYLGGGDYRGCSILRRVNTSDFLKIRFRYCNSGAATVTATVAVYTAASSYPYYPTSLVGSTTIDCPVTGAGVYVTVDSNCFAQKLTKGQLYCFVITWAGDKAINIPIEWNTNVSFSYWNGTAWKFSGYYAPYLVPVGAVEREIGSDEYQLVEGASSTTVKIDYGETTITAQDMSSYGRFIRASYFYGKLPAEEIMEQIVERAGFTAARAGSLAQGSAIVGFYNTSNYSYLECLQELADLYEPTQGIQWAFARDMTASGLTGNTVRFAARRKPWSDAIVAGIYSDDPASLSGNKKVLSHGLRNAFESKVGTVRIVGQAFDGSPIFVELDDRLWSAQGSLVELTGSPLMDVINDTTVTTGEQAVMTAEAIIREEHQNHLEGPLTIQGLHPELWQLNSAQTNFGSSQVFGVTSPAYGLAEYAAIARQITLGGKETALSLDNLRRQDQTMLRRSMDKAMRAESFAIESMPAFVAIAVRYSSTLPTDYAQYDRMKLIRDDGVEFSTTTFSTIVRRTDDSCSPTGTGYSHFAGYFPAHRDGGPSSYKYSGGAASLHRIDKVALGKGDSTWITVTLPRPYWVWRHQAVLVDFYGPRP